MTADPRPARHDLVWLVPGWRAALRAPVEPRLLDEAERWTSRGRPAVAARRGTLSGAPDDLALGIALPGPGKRRVALRVAPAAVARVAPPVALRDAVESAPARWRARLAALDVEARAAGLPLAVYGSLSWQHLSGEGFVRDGSDVDLLASPRSAAELRSALALLAAHAGERDPALDGELLLGLGRAVAWRELLSGARRVLVKSGTAVALEEVRDALGALAEDGYP
jgi:phosphoribosyl-dephospho-CoA transferase